MKLYGIPTLYRISTPSRMDQSRIAKSGIPRFGISKKLRGKSWEPLLGLGLPGVNPESSLGFTVQGF